MIQALLFDELVDADSDLISRPLGNVLWTFNDFRERIEAAAPQDQAGPGEAAEPSPADGTAQETVPVQEGRAIKTESLDEIAERLRTWKVHLQDWIDDNVHPRCAENAYEPEAREKVADKLVSELHLPGDDDDWNALLADLRLHGRRHVADAIVADWATVADAIDGEAGNSPGHYFQLDNGKTAVGNLASTLDKSERELCRQPSEAKDMHKVVVDRSERNVEEGYQLEQDAFAILRDLAQSPTRLKQADLQECTQPRMDRRTVSRHLKGLARRGFVEYNPTNKKGAAITPEGKAYLESKT